MNETREVNGLTLIKIPSHVQPSTPPLAIARNDFEHTVAEYIKQPSWFVAYLDYRVVIGKYTNNTDKFVFYPEHTNETLEPKYLQRLRVFNPNEELLLWRSDNGFKGRFRQDGSGEECEVIEAHQVLFGTRKGEHCDENFTEITEDRGTTLFLPFVNFKFAKEDKQTQVQKLLSRVCIKTYNYIEPNAVHQMTYTDCRFVSFTDSSGKAL